MGGYVEVRFSLSSHLLNPPLPLWAGKRLGTPRGPPAWAKGTKLAYLKSHIPGWSDARDDRKAISAFYDRITDIFIAMYGYDLPLKEDGPRLMQEEDVSLTQMSAEEVSKEEAERRSAFRITVRQVGIYLTNLHDVR